LEVLEDRWVPSVTPLYNAFNVSGVGLMQQGPTEQWVALEIDGGIYVPLGSHGVRFTGLIAQNDVLAAPYALSNRNGWAAGGDYLWNINDPTHPSVLTVPAGSVFGASAVSDNQVVVGVGSPHFYEAGGAAYWTATTGLQYFPDSSLGAAECVSADGTTVAGYIPGPSYESTLPVLFSRTGPPTLLDIGNAAYGNVSNLSPDGRNIAGSVLSRPAAWIDGQLVPLTWGDGSQVTGVLDGATDDGYFVGYAQVASGDRGIIWNPSFNGIDSPFNGVQYFDDWYTAVTGESFDQSSADVRAVTLSNDGTYYFDTSFGSGPSTSQSIVSVNLTHAIPPDTSTSLHVSGTDSNDLIYVDATGLSNIDVNTFAGDDTVVIHGDASANPIVHINAGSGNDSVTIDSPGRFSVNLGNGDDSIWIQANAVVSVRGGNGNDFLSATAGTINAVLGNGDDQLFLSSVSGVFTTGRGNDSITGYDVTNCRINMGDGADQLDLTNASNSTIVTGSGNDDVCLEGFYNSSLSTGGGNDTVDLSDGANVTVHTGAGADNVTMGGFDNAQIWTEGGNDQLALSSSYNVKAWTGNGNDMVSLFGISGGSIWTGAGNDHVVSYLSTCIIDLGAGNDFYQNTGSNDIVLGGPGNDTFVLNGGSTVAFGEGGNNSFIVRGGTNIISGGAGNNAFSSRGGNNYVNLGSGLNLLVPQPTDHIVRNPNDVFLNRTSHFIRLRLNDYLALLAVPLEQLHDQGFRRPLFP
jgi:hypothetical protein